jgi:hypothetical protein
VSQVQQQRFAFLGIVFAIGAPLGVRLAKQAGWLASPWAAPVFAVSVGAFCVVGGIIAYRMTRAQVRRDLEDLQNTGKPR